MDADSLAAVSNVLTEYSHSFQFAFTIVCGAFAIPISKWVHERLPGDFPIQEPFYAVGIVIVCAFAMLKLWHGDIDIDRLIALAAEGYTAGKLFEKGTATVKQISTPQPQTPKEGE